MFKWTLVFLSLVIVSLAVGCNKDGSSMFRTLNASGMGLGIHFGQSADDVHAVLGEADGLGSRQGGANVEEYYLSLDPDTGDMPSVPPDPYAPQLALTYHNGQLTRIYNHYRPDDDKQPLPRFFVEALPGVKCGNRRSDFVTALGGETDRMRPDEWRFDAKDGRMIAVMAKFTRVEAVGEDLCSSLTITLAPAVSGGRGEKFDNKKDWRDILK